MILSTLHSVSQVLVLAGLLSVFITTLMLWKRVRMRMKNYYSQLERTASAFDARPGYNRIHMIDRIARNWPLILVILTGISFTGNAWLIYREFHRQSFVEMQNVHVLDRKGDYVFQMDVEDPDTNERRPFMIRFCPDYKPTEEMQAGTTLLYLKFERHDFCEEIAPDNLGYALRRDDHGKPILDTR